ncbi:hypothetical protein Hdeb2414_s0006g00206471 [Helianthus debilis subsp. tardiflorus]
MMSLVNLQNSNSVHQSNKLSKKIPFSDCDQSRSALVDLIILIVVIGACGFLIHPYITLLLSLVQWVIVKHDVISGPIVYGLLGLGVLIVSTAILAVTLFESRKCGQPGCRGLRKAVEFDIKIEKEDCVKNSSLGKCGLKKGLYELPRDYEKELEAELKKMAPVNGRVVLVFRGRCGCPVVRVVVPGPKKSNRKIKK